MRLYSIAIALRILIALSTRSFFQPDEYFQSLEPAHNLVFGYGVLTWEWLSQKPLRSIVYPALNVPIYWLLKLLAIDNVGSGWLLIAAPRLLHGAFAAITDLWVCELAKRVLGPQYVSTVLFISLTSFYHALSLSRSLSNSLETSLSTVAFAYYPWHMTTSTSPIVIRQRIRKVLTFAALACAARSTNALIWLFLFATLFWRFRSRTRLLTAILVDAIVAVVLTASLIFLIDSSYYQKPTFTPLNFLLTNLSSVSQFYGKNPWHYHIVQSLPILCTTALPFVLHGAWITLSSSSDGLKTMLACVAWIVGVYSFAGHKEWRFIHPLLPLLHIFAAKSLVDLHGPTKQTLNPKKKARTTPTRSANLLRRYVPPIRIAHLWLLLLPVPASVYVVLAYCSEPISVMHYLRHLPAHELHGSVGFLMPCHSTPGHAYLHRKELAIDNRLWALGCEPPLANQNLTSYRDQTDVFFDSPRAYLQRYFPPAVDPAFPPSPFPTSIPGGMGTKVDVWEHRWPRYLVLFGALLEEEGVRLLFEEKGYSELWKKGGQWGGEGRRKGGIRVWKHSQ